MFRVGFKSASFLNCLLRKNSKTTEKGLHGIRNTVVLECFQNPCSLFGFFCILAESGSKAGCANPLKSTSPVDFVIFSYKLEAVAAKNVAETAAVRTAKAVEQRRNVASVQKLCK